MTFKKVIFIVLTLILFSESSFALSDSEAVTTYYQELVKIGVPAEAAQKKADQELISLSESMKNSQSDMEIALAALEKRTESVQKNDTRRDQVLEDLELAKESVAAYLALSPDIHFDVQIGIAGVLPRLVTTQEFETAQLEATAAMSKVNQTLILPARPGAVPEGDIVSDFIPQIIRQLFRFAWLAVLISFIVAGIYMVLARDNDDRITSAKTMIYYTIIGFVVIALAFAIVKGITNIDFFGFI